MAHLSGMVKAEDGNCSAQPPGREEEVGKVLEFEEVVVWGEAGGEGVGRRPRREIGDVQHAVWKGCSDMLLRRRILDLCSSSR